MQTGIETAEAYIPRSLEPVLEKAARQFPAVVLIGPRQSGKTTLLRHLYGARIPLVSLEPPDVRAAATYDPRGFLALNPPPVIFDEIQYAPDLLPYIKEQIDAERNRAGQFILTGSQNLLLMQKVTESLAGRAAILKLLPIHGGKSSTRLTGHWPGKLANRLRLPSSKSRALPLLDYGMEFSAALTLS